MFVFVMVIGFLAAFLFFITLFAYIRRRNSVDIYHRLRRHNISNARRSRNEEDIVRHIYLKLQRLAKPLADWEVAKK